MRTHLAPIALALAVLAGACTRRSDDTPRADSGETHITLSNPKPTAERAPLAIGDVRIVTADSGIDLALVGDTISSGLSEHAIAKVRQETDTNQVTGTGFGADLEKMVKGTVQKAVGTRVAFPISSVRTVRYDGRGIAFEWAGKPPKIFGSTKVDDKPLLESFPPEDARRFADAVMARKRARGM